jgi:osmotically inducible protein OsmC
MGRRKIMATRKANAEWRGNLKDGEGIVRFGHGAFEGVYSFASRFEQGGGTNPEELIAAAHASCYSMALSHGLSQAGHAPISVHTVARVHLEKDDSGFHIPRIELETRADVPGVEEGEFQQEAEKAKQNCPVSRLFQGAEITLQAQLANAGAPAG